MCTIWGYGWYCNSNLNNLIQQLAGVVNWLQVSVDFSCQLNWVVNQLASSINLIHQSLWFINHFDSSITLIHKPTWDLIHQLTLTVISQPINLSYKLTWFVSFMTCKTFCPFVLQCVVDVVFILKCRNVHVFH